MELQNLQQGKKGGLGVTIQPLSVSSSAAEISGAVGDYPRLVLGPLAGGRVVNLLPKNCGVQEMLALIRGADSTLAMGAQEVAIHTAPSLPGSLFTMQLMEGLAVIFHS